MSDNSDNYLKHCVPGVQFKYDAANTPHVTRIWPAQLWKTTITSQQSFHTTTY